MSPIYVSLLKPPTRAHACCIAWALMKRTRVSTSNEFTMIQITQTQQINHTLLDESKFEHFDQPA